jgi:hypothetical protein
MHQELMKSSDMIRIAAACMALAWGIAPAAAEFDYGKFEGKTLKVKLIGGT